MGTVGRVSYSPIGVDLRGSLAGRADEIEAQLTRFRDDSEIATLSDEWREVSHDTAAVMRAAQRLQARTGGYFSVLVGGHMRRWTDVAHGSGYPPDASPVSGVIDVDGTRCRVVGAEPRSVDLGGIAKGYASDVLRDRAVGMGASDVLVSLGASSHSVAGAPARIALASPWLGWERIGTLMLQSGSLSVSADPGTRIGMRRQRSHVLDPSNGRPALTDLCGVVVCGPDGMECEAYSTAYLVCGLDGALELHAQRPELKAVFMTVDGRLLASPGLELTVQPGFRSWAEGQRRLSAS